MQYADVDNLIKIDKNKESKTYLDEIRKIVSEDSDITVKKLAKVFNFSLRSFYNHWSHRQSPKELLNKFRLSLAKKLLLQNHKKKIKIKEIAYRLSFCDECYFSKWFRHHTGVSPRVFQRNRQGK